MPWWVKIDNILNARRIGYAYIAGGILWLAWLISVILGPGNMDLAGQVVGTDYLQFYSAGLTLHQGQSSNLYDFPFQTQLEQAIAGPGLENFHAFITPPFLAWLFIPFSLIPYAGSFIAWSALSLSFLWISIRIFFPRQTMKVFFVALTWFPIFACVSFGQNSLLSLLLISLTYYFWKKRQLFTAGLISSLLLFKPQLFLGIGILWLLEWRKDWKALSGLIFGGVILAGLCFLLLPEASLAYVKLARDFLPTMINADLFPLWHLHSLRGFWTLLLPGQPRLAEGLSVIISLAGIIAFYTYWGKNRSKNDTLFALAVCLTIWISPHAMIYDWTILLVPALLFWRSQTAQTQLWKPMYALMWLATFLSGPLTYAQLQVFQIALQISIPLLFIVYFTIWKELCNLKSAVSELVPIND